MTRYQHTQSGSVQVVLLGALFALVAYLCAAKGEWGALAFSGALLGFAASQMYRMTVRVDGGKVEVSSGTGLLRKTVDLREVVACERVRNRWYYGWGIRWYPGGLLVNVAGLDAVELRYRDGGKLRIGTDQPWQLTDAIQAEMAALRGESPA